MDEGQPDAVSSVEYRDLEGAYGYRVGSDGSVWTLRRRRSLGYGRGSTSVMTDVWRPLKQSRDTCGYRVVTILFPFGQRMRKVHRLVCAAFNGPCPDGMQCCHNDGVKSNNRAGNLRWGTPKENSADRARHGRHRVMRGIDSANAKLTEADVRAIRALAASGTLTQKEIGERFGIVQSAVGNIIHRKRWKHLEDAA